MGIEYDVPIEVTGEQRRRIARKFPMIVAHREDSEGRHWIKLWAMEYKEALQRELNI